MFCEDKPTYVLCSILQTRPHNRYFLGYLALECAHPVNRALYLIDDMIQDTLKTV